MNKSGSMSLFFLGIAMLSSTVWAAPLKLDLSQTTVSGLSSGGYMATQFHLAHADWVKGVGVIAAGPYYCAQNNLLTALSSCVNKTEPVADLNTLNTYLEEQRRQGRVAPADALKDDKAWVLHGTLDKKVIKPVAEQLVSQYQQWLGDEQVKYVGNQPFSHHFPTRDQGTPCSQSVPPFIGNCNYDAAGEMLSFLLPEAQTPNAEAKGTLHVISQPKDVALADKGWVYIPEQCQQGQACTLHISFHGCNQYAGAEGVTEQYARLTGLNRWADANSLVVLYPQTKASMPFNPQGCWDWWGYTDEYYATRQGQQIRAVAELARELNGVAYD